MTGRQEVTVPNRVCPNCAEGFSLNGVVVPVTPMHELCQGDVPDLDAPGGGWRCSCPCRTWDSIPSAETFGVPTVIQHPPRS